MGIIYITDAMFTRTKNLKVMEGKELKEDIDVSPEAFNEILFNLIDKYHCSEIKIKGMKIFSTKLKEDINKSLLSKYAKDKEITVTII